MPVGEHLTTRDVAKRLRVTVARVSQFVMEKRLKPSIRVGTMMFFDEDEVAEFAKKPRRPGPPKKD